jgi:hypothetical protein
MDIPFEVSLAERLKGSRGAFAKREGAAALRMTSELLDAENGS